MVKRTASANLPTQFGQFRIIVFQCDNGMEQVALLLGEIKNPVLVRMHSSCITGDVFFSMKCDCGEQLEKAMETIQKNGSGVILYLHQEGRGIGLTNKINAYALQDTGLDTVEANEQLGLPADARDYQVAADILKDLGITQINLLTNNPDKEDQLKKYGIEVVKRVALEVPPNPLDKEYLKTKKIKMAHKLTVV